MQLKKELLLSILYEDIDADSPWTIVENDIIDTSRWSEIYNFTIHNTETNKYYNTTYSCGATECQYERPWEYEGDLIDVIEVEPKEVTVIQYVPVTK
jgi:hypothetical protein